MEGKALVVLELSASGSKRLPVSLYGSSIGAVNLLFDSLFLLVRSLKRENKRSS